MQVSKRNTASGLRYDVRWRVGDKVYTRTFHRRKDADAFAVTIEADRLKGIVIDPRRGNATFESVAKKWQASTPTKRARSKELDEMVLRVHILPTIGDRAIATITPADIQSLVDIWTAKLSPSTVHRQYSCLRAIMSYAVKADIIYRSPCRNIRLPRVSLVKRPSLSTEQLECLADALGDDYAAMMWCGVVLGLRWSEAAGLTVDRLDLLNGRLTVDRQLSRARTLEPPKSEAGVRTLACPAWLIDELAAVLARRKLTAADGDELIFTTPSGRALFYTDWRRYIWLPACNAAGLPGLRFHDLRSLAATALVTTGVDVKTAQTRLGHASPQITLALYARTTIEADQRAADMVGNVFRPRDKRAMRHLTKSTGHDRNTL